MTKNDLDFNGSKIERKFTDDWRNSGTINIDKLPQLVEAVLEQHRQMVKYIEALHDKIDDLLETNECCHVPGCHRAGCTSDHK